MRPDSGFTADERSALASVLDAIVPPRPEVSLPGAGELGVAEHVERVIQGTPGLRPLIAQGLSALDARARSAGAHDFRSLSPADRAPALEAVTGEQPHFLPTLIFHTYVGYYRDLRVMEALGLEPRPPFPRGFEVAPSDPSLLDAVRRRPRMYRAC